MTAALAGLYAALLLVVGVALRRTGGGGREAAYLAGRRLGPGLVAATLTATAIGGSATVVLARFVHQHGLAGLWLDLPLGLALIVFGLLLARRVRASGRLSLPDLAGARYGPVFRRVLGGLVVLAEIAWFALLVRAAAPFLVGLAPSLGEDSAVLLLALVFVAYTALGGQAAVAWTDGVQLLLVGGLGLIVPAVAMLSATNGLADLPPRLTGFPTGLTLDALDIVGLVALVGLPGLVGGDIYSKTLSARDGRAARTGALLAGGMKLVATLCVGVLALGHHLLLPDLPNDNHVLPRAIAAVLPGALVALAGLGFLAAMMSSADSVLLTGATVVDVDLLPPPRDDRAERQRVRVLIAALGVAGTLLALALESVVAIMRWAYTVFAAGAPLPILLGFQRRIPVPSWAATASLLVGGGVAVATKLGGIARPAPVLIGLGAAAGVLGIGVAHAALQTRGKRRR